LILIHIIAGHAGHLWGSWVTTAGVIALSLALLVLVAMVIDRRAP
jgi:hypothetical protein